MHYYRYNIGDFDRATRHLTRTERSIYRDLLDLYYDTEARISLDMTAVCRLVLARSDEERTAVEQVLTEFFSRTATGWFHSRCEDEIADYHANQSQKATAGKASAAAKRLRKQQALNENSTGVEQTNNGASTKHKPLTTKQKEEDQEPLSAAQTDDPSRFDEFFREYPRDEGKKKARAAWDKHKIERIADRVIADVRRRKLHHGPWLDNIIPHATTYINGERWNDAIDPKRKPTYGNFSHEKPGAVTAVINHIRIRHGDGPLDLSGFSDDEPCAEALPC